MKKQMLTSIVVLFCLAFFTAGVNAQLFDVDASQINTTGSQSHYDQDFEDPFEDPEFVRLFLERFQRGEDRIVGGNPVLIDDYPWQISLQLQPAYGGAHFCGGTIVNDKWVITASHCLVFEQGGDDFYLQPFHVRVRAGFSHMNNASQGSYYNVSQLVLHPSYNTNSHRFDIALVRIANTFDFDHPGKAPVDIVTQEDASNGMTNPGVQGWVSGWGTLSYGGSSPNQLHAVQVPIVGGHASYPPSLITPDMIMAGATGKDACQGDSGGPYVVPDGNDWHKLAGVVSFGTGCGWAGYPGVYARVSYFESWLNQYLDDIPPDGPQEVTFHVTNQVGQPVSDAMITVYPGGNKSINSSPVKMTRSAEPNDAETTIHGFSEDHENTRLPLRVAENTLAGSMPSYANDDKTGEWIKYWQTGVNDNALGLGGTGAQWFAAIRWMPADLADYEGTYVTKIRVFINDAPLNGFATIWQGDINNPVVMRSQEFTPVAGDWVEIVLSNPYPIDTSQELWIGWEIGDPGDGVFPAAFETSSQHDQLANLLQFGDNPWQFASAFGFEVVWNIEAYVEQLDFDPIVLYTDANGQASFTANPMYHTYTVEKDGYFDEEGSFEVSNMPLDIVVDLITESDDPFVTFNVDMNDVEGFEWDQHTVYLTGSFTGWAEPGTPGSIEMTLVPDQKNPPYTLYENFDGFDDFTTNLSPWTTLQLTSGNTWGAGDFDFPGEGTEFAWMAFNPSQTVPPIDGTNPTIDGSRMGMAIQYMNLNDNKWLISPEVSIHSTSELSFWARSYTHTYGAERIRVMVSTTGTNPSDFTPISTEPFIEVPVEWTQYSFDLGAYADETIHFAINYVSHDAFIFWIDAIELTADVEPDPPSNLIYTATLQLPLGHHEYKYFSDAIGDGWDGGEWSGGDNRVIYVTGDMIVNNTWGIVDDPDDPPYPVTFNVNNQGGQPIANAMITVYPQRDKSQAQPMIMTRSINPPDAKGDSGLLELHASGNTLAGAMPPYADNAKDDGEWIKYWQTGVNDNALGLGGDGATWYAAIRWMPEDLDAYEGYEVTSISVFMNDQPLEAAAVIWQGDIDNPVQLVNETMMVDEEEWVVIELSEPYLIDTSQELWIGWEIYDPGDGVFPAAFETSTQDDQLANLLQFGDNPWNFASAYGFDVVWNIEAFVAPAGEPDPDPEPIILYTNAAGQASFAAMPGAFSYVVEKEGFFDATGNFNVSNAPVNINVTMMAEAEEHFVTFNVDMTDVEGFDPAGHNVYLTGTLTDWAEPGTEGSLEMSLVRNDKTPPYNFYENFDSFDDFTTDLSPWITLRLTTGNNYGASDFSYPGEGTDFSWMVFNPSQTVPPIDDDYPPFDGDKVAIAVQYIGLNDNKWLISPEFSIHETSELSFWAVSSTAQYGLERIRVLVSTSGSEPDDFTPISTEPFIEVPTEWTQYSFDLGDYAGEVIRFAINYVSYDAFMFVIDAISLTADVDDEPYPDELIYTVTVPVYEGHQEYKYFSNAFGAGWDGGEWDGDPNREIYVLDDMVVNDVWGVITPPVTPLALNTLANMTGDDLPAQIGTGGNARAGALYMDRYVVVPSREDGPNVWVWDSHNPDMDPFALVYDAEIIEPLVFPINYVRTAGDAIYVSNLSLNPAGEGWAQGVFRIYRWNDFETGPEIVVSYDVEPGRLGDAFSIIGDPKGDGHIIAHINATKDFRVWTFEDGVLINEDNPEMITLNVDVPNLNNHGIFNPIPGEEDLFLVTSNNMGLMIANLDGDVIAAWGTDIIDQRTYDPNIFYYNGSRYLTYTINNEGNADVGARYQIVDITPGDNVVEAFEAITNSNELAVRIVRNMSLGAGHANLTATNQVVFNDNDELVILAYVVGTGFVVETTDGLPDSFNLELLANPANGGTVTGGGTFAEGTHVTVSAVAAAGFEFVNWTHGGDMVSEDAEFVYIMPAEDVTLTANFLSDIEEVASLAELRAKPADGSVYLFTGNAVIVAMDGFRNRKFIQDETAAILIDDQPGTITTQYELYDVITDVMGTINIWNEMVRFQPVANTPEAVDNTPVDPVVFNMDEVSSGDQAKLIKFHDVEFVNVSDGQVFANGTNYVITDGENEFVLRTDFWNVDYIGEEIPHVPLNIAGVMIQFQADYQIVPRFAADMEVDHEEDVFNVTFIVEDADGGAITNAVITLGGVTNAEGDYLFADLEPGVYEFLVTAEGYHDYEGQVEVVDDHVSYIVVMTEVDHEDDVFTVTFTVENEDGDAITNAVIKLGEVTNTEGDYVFADLEPGVYEFLVTAVGYHDYEGEVEVVDDHVTYTVVMEVDDTSVPDTEAGVTTLFPNPASSQFTIASGSMIKEVIISDVSGRTMKHISVDANEVTVNTSNFNNGLYIVSVYTSSGVSVTKLHIQK